MNEDLLNKLKKLLNLSKSGNQFEAELALQKATAMAVENGIDLAMISMREDKQEEKLEMVKEELNSDNKRIATTQKYASWILGAHFNVKVFYNGSRYTGRNVIFLGDRKDVEFAKFVNEFLQDDMQRRWEYYKKTNNVDLRYKQTFMYNCWRGLDSKLTQAKNDAKQQRFSQMAEGERNNIQARYSLVVASKAQAVEAFAKKIFPECRTVRSSISNYSNSSVANDAFSIGRSMNINRPISG
jgi:hypothetical protein